MIPLLSFDLEQKYTIISHILPFNPTLLISFTTLTTKDSTRQHWRSVLFFNELLRNTDSGLLSIDLISTPNKFNIGKSSWTNSKF
jgi:hypothetical protein